MSGRRLDVTPTHAVSSLLATLTGAIAASGLGVAGTIIGAAVMSLASTVGTAVYKHYLGRSNQRLRTVAENLAPLAGGNAVATAIIRHHLAPDAADTMPIGGGKHAVPAHATQPAGSQPAGSQPAGSQPATTRADATRESARAAAGPGAAAAAEPGSSATTMPATVEPPAPVEWVAGPADGADPPNGATSTGHAYGVHPTQGLGPVTQTQASSEPVSPAPASPEPTALPVGLDSAAQDGHSGQAPRPRRSSRRTWLMAAAAALGVFVIAMGGITAFEAIAGKPLDALVWHHSDTGTTFGNAVNSHPAHHSQTPKPSVTPASTSPSTNPSTPASTSPTPSTSVAPTTSPTAGITSPATGTTQAPAA
jgi:hypothetical protein